MREKNRTHPSPASRRLNTKYFWLSHFPTKTLVARECKAHALCLSRLMLYFTHYIPPNSVNFIKKLQLEIGIFGWLLDRWFDVRLVKDSRLELSKTFNFNL